MLCHAGLIGDDADDVVQGLGTDMGMGDISMFFCAKDLGLGRVALGGCSTKAQAA